MAYWQSSENYPDKNPIVWDALCGQKIRHHKMPDSTTPGGTHFEVGTGEIRVLGVEFGNIAVPIDNNGNPIPGIAGYEILRGSREGNKTIVAKGLLNNMGSYDREDSDASAPEIAYYQNYPYNDLRPDPFLNKFNFLISDTDNGTGSINNTQGAALGGSYMQDDKFTFHSPDTQFKHPFLSAKELKIYENHHGLVDGTFNEPYKHSEHKLVTDSAFILAGLVGFGLALKAMQGVRKSKRDIGSANENIIAATDWSTAATVGSSFGSGLGYGVDQAAQAATSVIMTASQIALAIEEGLKLSGIDALQMIAGGMVGESSVGGYFTSTLQNTGGTTTGIGIDSGTEFSSDGETGMPGPLRIFQTLPTFFGYWTEGTQTFIDLIQAMSRTRQYTLAYESHCFYDNSVPYTSSNNRFKINNSSYIGDRLQEFGGITVNNLYRSSCVGLTTEGIVPPPLFDDTSRRTFKQAWGIVYAPFVGKQVKKTSSLTNGGGRASSHYVGLKQRLRNQYGQTDGIKQVPTSSCMQTLTPLDIDPNNPGKYITDVIFGGDTYIGRYTEKNSFFYFFDWMLDLPDEFEYDYRLRKMMPYPTYWMDTHDFQVSDFITGLFDMIFNVGGGGILPTSWHNFDTSIAPLFQANTLLPSSNSFPPSLPNIKMIVDHAYMYLFNSGVRDFIVESEVNIEYRDWGEEEEQRHYDPRLHTDLVNMFRSDRIKAGNFFKYDYSLQASRYYQGFASWGSVQYRNYDPFIAESCYTYYPNRLIYSLPQEKELRYDNWVTYLINNYRDFTSRVTTIKPIGKNGAMMLFENEAPITFTGTDTLQTGAGTEITIGDGGLFNQALQNIVNADQSYEYGSCQDKLSVINTPAGLFWISQNQGKIFNYTGQLEDISQSGMKWWFDEFLPYKIVEDFPNFELLDNTVIGVGCQAIYDNSNGTVYFTKRDYKLRKGWEGRVQYVNEDNFYY